jgi:hypothetical protein
MPSGTNALRRNALQTGAGDIASQVRGAMKKTQALLADVGNANSEEMQAAAAALSRGIKKVLSKRGPVIGGTQRKNRKTKDPRVPRRAPSAPGQPPALQTAGLRRSIRKTVTDGAVRVGTNYFTGRLLQDGVSSSASPAVAKGTVVTTKSGKRRKSRGRKATRAHVIEPRPFMERGLELAQAEMTDVFVSTAQRKGAA